MIGKDWDRVMDESEKGIALCKDFKYEPLKPECEKLIVEF